MVDFIGGIVEGAKRQFARDTAQVVNEAVVKPLTGAVTDYGKQAAGALTGKFNQNADLGAITKDLPNEFDPRTSQHMVNAVEGLLKANRVLGRPDGKLDGNDLKSLNKFNEQQGNKAVPDWESFDKKYLNSLLTSAAEKNSKNPKAMDGIISELKLGVAELKTSVPEAKPEAEPKSGLSGFFNGLADKAKAVHEANVAADAAAKEAAANNPQQPAPLPPGLGGY